MINGQTWSTLKRLAVKHYFSAFKVLEIGCSLGESTRCWFHPWQERVRHGVPASPPKVVCVDPFDYKQCSLQRISDLNCFKTNPVNWIHGSMQNDYMDRLGPLLQYVSMYRDNIMNDPVLPYSKFDIVWIDRFPESLRLFDILDLVKKYVVPYSCLIAGRNYDSGQKFISSVDDVNRWVYKERALLRRGYDAEDIWGISIIQ